MSPDGLCLDALVNLVKFVNCAECGGDGCGLEGHACNPECDVEGAMLVIMFHNVERNKLFDNSNVNDKTSPPHALFNGTPAAAVRPAAGVALWFM